MTAHQDGHQNVHTLSLHTCGHYNINLSRLSPDCFQNHICITLINLFKISLNTVLFSSQMWIPNKMATKMAIHCLFINVV